MERAATKIKIIIGTARPGVVIGKKGTGIKPGGLAFVHNHPSGKSEPSRADVLINNELISTVCHVGISVLDYVVVGQIVVSMAVRALISTRDLFWIEDKAAAQ